VEEKKGKHIISEVSVPRYGLTTTRSNKNVVSCSERRIKIRTNDELEETGSKYQLPESKEKMSPEIRRDAPSNTIG
jgi:hypothetical protein